MIERGHHDLGGLPADKIMSTFPAIDTAVDNVKICQGLEHIAKVMDRGTLIRSHVLPDLGNILHSRHQYHWHTGYVPPQTVAAPHLGAWVAKVLGPRHPAIPAFIDVLDAYSTKITGYSAARVGQPLSDFDFEHFSFA